MISKSIIPLIFVALSATPHASGFEAICLLKDSAPSNSLLFTQSAGEHFRALGLIPQKLKSLGTFVYGERLYQRSGQVDECARMPLNDRMFCEEGYYFLQAYDQLTEPGLRGRKPNFAPRSDAMALGLGLALGILYEELPERFIDDEDAGVIVDGWAFNRFAQTPLEAGQICSHAPRMFIRECTFGVGRGLFFFGMKLNPEALQALRQTDLEAGFQFAYVFAGEQPARPDSKIEQFANLMRTGRWPAEFRRGRCYQTAHATDCLGDL